VTSTRVTGSTWLSVPRRDAGTTLIVAWVGAGSCASNVHSASSRSLRTSWREFSNSGVSYIHRTGHLNKAPRLTEAECMSADVGEGCLGFRAWTPHLLTIKFCLQLLEINGT